MTIIPLANGDELLRRQVHPTLFDPVRGVSKSAFTPQKGHHGMLSTLRERVSPSEAYERFTSSGSQSAGTWPVQVGNAESHGLRCVDDSTEPETPADHASVDFNGLDGSVHQAARKLAEYANSGEPLFAPPS